MAAKDEVPSTSKQAVREQMGPDQLQGELRRLLVEITESIKILSIDTLLGDFNEFLDVFKVFEEKANAEMAKGNESTKQYYTHNKSIVEGWVENIRMLVELEAEKRQREKERDVMRKEDAEREIEREKARQEALIREAEKREEIELIEELKRKRPIKIEKSTSPLDFDENTMTSQEEFHGFEPGELGNAFTQFLERFKTGKKVSVDTGEGARSVESHGERPAEISEIKVEISRETQPNIGEQTAMSFHEDMESPKAQNKNHDGLNFDYSTIDKINSRTNDKLPKSIHTVINSPVEQNNNAHGSITITRVPTHPMANIPVHPNAGVPAHSMANIPVHPNASVPAHSMANVSIPGAYAQVAPNPSAPAHSISTVPLHTLTNMPINSNAYSTLGPKPSVPMGMSGHGSIMPKMYMQGYSGAQFPIYSNMPGAAEINSNMGASTGMNSNIPRSSYVNIQPEQHGIYPHQASYMPGYGFENRDSNYPIEMAPAILNGKIEVPAFDGIRGEDWLPFYSIFHQFIHCNGKMNEITKLSMLKSRLTGRALEVVRGYPLLPGNYAHAWMAVLSRYHKQDQLAFSLMTKVDNLQPLRRNDYGRLEELVNATNQMMLSLPEIGIDITNCDSFIKHMLFKKFDEDMMLQWRQYAGDTQGVPAKEVVKFLEMKLIAMNIPRIAYASYQLYQNNNNSNNRVVKGYPSNQNIQNNRAQVVHQVVEKKSQICFNCKGGHFIYECPELTKLRASERSKFIQKLKLCMICLGKPHPKGGKCPKCCLHCQGPHNLFLCYKRENEFMAKRREEEEKKNGGQAANVHHA